MTDCQVAVVKSCSSIESLRKGFECNSYVVKSDKGHCQIDIFQLASDESAPWQTDADAQGLIGLRQRRGFHISLPRLTPFRNFGTFASRDRM
jgi:hypothetical protein